MTETLSTLTRDQLQKLLQYAINEDPGGVLGRVFQHIGIQIFGFIMSPLRTKGDIVLV